MKTLIKNFFTNKPLSACWNDITLLLFRLFAGGLMLPYGWGKIEKYDEYCINFFDDPIGIGMIPSLWLTIFAQLGCSAMLMAGFMSRPAAAVLAFNMLVATRYHWHDGLATVSLPALFLAIYIFLTFTGGGRLSVDRMLFKNK